MSRQSLETYHIIRQGVIVSLKLIELQLIVVPSCKSSAKPLNLRRTKGSIRYVEIPACGRGVAFVVVVGPTQPGRDPKKSQA